MNEGVIKFKAIWQERPLPALPQLPELIRWRQVLFEAGMIGAYADGTGYGNISCRVSESGAFVISGSGTGGLAQLTEAHFSLVEHVDLDRNELQCSGPVIASSESMSHAAVYQAWPDAGAVVHIHDARRWKNWLNKLPTTEASAAYGTVAMARSIGALTRHIVARQGRAKVIIMAGHPEGIIAFGKNLEQAVAELFRLGSTG